MRGVCVTDKYCQYKTGSGYCGYTGTECVKDYDVLYGLHKINLKDPPMITVKQVELTDECIQRIAEAIAKELKRY